MLRSYFETYVKGYRAYKSGAWCYEDGCIYRGLELLHRATGDQRWFDYLKELVDAQIEPGPRLAGFNPEDFNIDNIMAGRSLLYLHDVTGEQRYLDCARLLIDQLKDHPRTKSGVYWHKLRYPWQVWLDGLYMGAPFQIGYGLKTDQPELVADALGQIETALEMTHVPETGLYAHAVDEAREQKWADPATGHSSAHWSRALGWLAMALVDTADLVGQDAFTPLHAKTVELMSRIANLQRPEGLWLQVIDQPDLDGNYDESSASAMFAYALAKAKTLGLWDGDAGAIINLLTDRTVKTNGNGQAEMVNICEVAGLGEFQGRYRDGSAAYYLSEAVVADDAKGVGPLMMCEALRVMQSKEAVPA